FVSLLGCRRVVVGRDMRGHSAPLFDALADGLTQQGADVIDLGLCSTPMCYFGNGSLGADGSIMITASHNPGSWNGFKLCREKAVPISNQTGIADLEQMVAEDDYAVPPGARGTITAHDVAAQYRQHIVANAALRRPLRIAVDFANAMGVVEHTALDGLPLTSDRLFGELDGSFPNHEANPLNPETLEALQTRVAQGGYDFGIAYDGDADRVGFVDERGEIVAMDTITALIASTILAERQGPILYDLRSSRAVREVILEAGGEPHMSRVGHAFIKQQMRDIGALFAGELSGHYYFSDNYFAESAALAVLRVANLVSASDVPLSGLVSPLQRYFASGEINSEVADVEAVFARLRREFPDAEISTLDGISVEYDDWWFNVRASNTEPLVRLNLEAGTQEALEQRTAQVLRMIRAGGD
ncbi:MAG: phosphomannomutase/phosphoglucomutase, partial [Gammaproteobacteria bacterium]